MTEEQQNRSLSNLEEAVLIYLKGRRAYGQEISKAIEAAFEAAFEVERKISPGSLYPCLRRLEEKGLASSDWDSNSLRRDARRRYYHLSAKGVALIAERKSLREKLEQRACVD